MALVGDDQLVLLSGANADDADQMREVIKKHEKKQKSNKPVKTVDKQDAENAWSILQSYYTASNTAAVRCDRNHTNIPQP